MKILQISAQVPVPRTDGGKIGVYGITKGLFDRGHQIDFVCYRKDSNYEYSIKELKKICNPYILDIQTDNNIFGAFINLFSNVPYNSSKYIKKELTNFLNNFLPDKNYDVVHVTHLHMGWVIDVIKKYLNVPVILREENLETMIMKRFSEHQKNWLIKKYSNLQYRKLIKYEPFICKKFDRCVMVTKFDEKRLLDFDNSIKTTHIPSGIESSLLLKNKNKIEPFSIVHIGHLDWYPNYDSLKWFLDEIMPNIVSKIPQVKLYIYGGGEPKGFRISEELSSNVILKGFVNDIWEELSTKALAVVPLRIGSGIRIKILEMLAAGQNIITTTVGKEGIDAVDGKDLLIADSSDEFSNKIINFFSNEYNNLEMMNNGRKLIKENYTWEKISEKFENLYLNLIDEKL